LISASVGPDPDVLGLGLLLVLSVLFPGVLGEGDMLGVEADVPESATLLEVPPEHEPINKQTDNKQLSFNFTIETPIMIN
jgi:hypothetical protein